MNNVLIANNNVLYSELQEDENSLIAKFIICDFGVNGNGVMLNRKTIGTWLDTIISQPVVAAIGVNDDGTCDFEGHNMSLVQRVDENGDTYQDAKFDTSAIGVFDSVEIVTINNKEYIVATAKLWKRYPDFCALVKKRMSEGTIATSWEIAVDSSHYEIIGGQKVKVIDKGSFLGHALLNKAFPPAYQDSQMLEVASKNQSDSDLIEAFKRDIVASKDSNINIAKKEDEILEENIEVSKRVVDNKEQNVDNVPKNETLKDTKPTDKPNETVKTKDETNKKIKKADTEKSANEEKAEEVKSDKDIISELNSKIAELNETIEKQNASLVEASSKVQGLTKEVSELTPFKESCEKAEQERIEKETAEKRENLKGYAIKSGFITENEVSSVDEIKNCIENVDEKGLKAIIAERFMKSLDNKTDVETSSVNENKGKEVETSEVKTNIVDSEETDTDYKLVMKTFLNK